MDFVVRESTVDKGMKIVVSSLAGNRTFTDKGDLTPLYSLYLSGLLLLSNLSLLGWRQETGESLLQNDGKEYGEIFLLKKKKKPLRVKCLKEINPRVRMMS